jgi:protein SCO1/2
MGVVSASASDLTVHVLASDPRAYTLTVKGEGLPAPDKDGIEVLKVSLGDAEAAYTGHLIQGDLSQSEGHWRLDDIWPADPDVISAAADATAQLHRDTVELGRKAIRGVGDTLPAFALYNQDGEIVRPETLRGRRLVINFIFTRCNNPNMCPANTARMAELQKGSRRRNSTMSPLSLSRLTPSTTLRACFANTPTPTASTWAITSS